MSELMDQGNPLETWLMNKKAELEEEEEEPVSLKRKAPENTSITCSWTKKIDLKLSGVSRKKINLKLSGVSRKKIKQPVLTPSFQVNLSVGSRCITELLRDTERNPKSLFICMFDNSTGLPITTRTDVQLGLFHEVQPLDYPDHLRRSHGYSVAALGSKVYYMGGHALSTTNGGLCIDIFDTVSAIDLQKSSWEAVTPMKQPRIHSIVFTYKNNIYVFGSSADRVGLWSPYTELTQESYAEYYDPDSDKWSYLPAPVPKEMVEPRRVLLSYALNDKDGVVYFWLSHIGVYLYDLEAKTWDKWSLFQPSSPIPKVPCPSVGPSAFPKTGPFWSTEVVFLCNFIIWHYYGTIYAFRCSDARLFTLFCFTYSVKVFGDPRSLEFRPSPSYLLNVGNGKLCLVHASQPDQQMSEEINYHVFRVRYSGNPPDDVKIELQLEETQGSGGGCCSILAVRTVNSEILQ